MLSQHPLPDEGRTAARSPGRPRPAAALLFTLGALLAAQLAHAPQASAEEENRGRFNRNTEDTSGQGGGDDRGLSAHAGITITTRGGNTGGGGPISSADTSWTPPPCYYAPTYTPTEFKQSFEDYLNNTPLHSGKGEAARMHEEAYGEDSEYNDHNLDREGEGMWWTSVINTASNDHEGQLACDEPTFWVDFGDAPPDIPGVPTPELLAELAYANTRVPETAIETNPEAEHTVNLPTWIWLDAADYQPVEVTAQVEGYDIWATTRAEPSALTIRPGTEDASLHPSSGTCPTGDGGAIGTPFPGGAPEQAPPCGVTYLRATHATGPYQLSAGLTWSVAWQGSGGTGGDLPDGTYTTAQDVEVQEIQTIVR
ncbi:hypothetical protein [Streptomyces triticirhizae]|uniref:Enoyl reductase n=1 Tax=Streptomyces triticirhizae TaxID=2483353 RepID=A0A3M2LV88_9ACTN|nr:hypothetical protein [Streptomyces triticirhizae]RMI41142.1 hypothetical protein EBN88_11645 [Streptomyces triticirhizae]